MRIIIEIDDRSISVQHSEPAEPTSAVNAGGPPQALVERLGAQAPRAAGGASSPAATGAIDAGGPPADLLKLLGAQAPRVAGGASTPATPGAINAGGPPADLLAARAKQR
jgi:hypothetical protein